MPAIHDLIEDWIQIRTMLQKQIKLLEADGSRGDAGLVDAGTEATMERLRRCLLEMNALLKQHAGADKA
jgi:hypothetical protein